MNTPNLRRQPPRTIEELDEFLSNLELAAGRFALSMRQWQRLVDTLASIVEAIARTPAAAASLGNLQAVDAGLQGWRTNAAALAATADALHARIIQLRKAPRTSSMSTKGPVH
jgi:hypothetical protein